MDLLKQNGVPKPAGLIFGYARNVSGNLRDQSAILAGIVERLLVGVSGAFEGTDEEVIPRP